MSTTDTWTVGKLLTWTTDYLKKAGSHSPRLDAEVLLSHARSCQRIELYTTFDEEPSEETKAAFREMVRRRAEGMPVAYLVGFKEFYSDTFEVNADVLIPRPETEHLVVEAVDCAAALRASRAPNGESPATALQADGEGQVDVPEGESTVAQPTQPLLRIADVGTGSGAIAITIAKHVQNCHVTAIDVSPKALAVARRNAERFGLSGDTIDFLESDLLAQCDSQKQFDLILSNPPYVSIAEYEQLETTVRDFEPKEALVGGAEGFELIARFLEQSYELLADDGYVIFEFSPMLAEKITSFVGEQWAEPKITKDLSANARLVTLKKRA